MSQNYSSGGSTPGQGTGGAGTGATDAGTTRDSSTGGAGQGLSTTGTGGGSQSTGGGTGAGTATGLAQTAQEYGQKIAGAASTAKDYVSDKVSVVGDKIGELRNKDFSEVATEAKEYARQNPGQALLISAAAGFVLGLLLRGSRR
jgi:ElaB/YqjD/DUF883 family membrane-anchored ribosome-binding protein